MPAPVVIDEAFDLSTLLPTAQIDQILGINALAYGDNYISTIVEDRSRGIASCDTQRVVLKDFEIFSFNGVDETPVTSGVRKTQGSFTGYSHFDLIPSALQSSGTSESDRPNAILEENFFSITN